ncbi:putative ankyrin repeat-containing domain-containing protein [Helianthus debilis subsp. tardiflorus]
MTNQTGEQLPTIDERKPLSQQQQQHINIHGAHSGPPPPPEKPACPDLINGPRDDYLQIGVPLYEASIKCDWKAAKAIFDRYNEMNLERYSITENGETALHVAASAKNPKDVEKFVKNLVGMMQDEDLELQNENHNTALYLAAVAGNIEAVKIMFERNKALLSIAGANGAMMPLYAAVLFRNEDVVKYMYNNSNNLGDKGWTPQNRGWLLEKCVEMDMFDVALRIVNSYPELRTGSVLGLLARKPEAFPETKFKIIPATINWCKHLYSKILTSHDQPSQNKDVGSRTRPIETSEPFPETKSNFIKRTIKSVSLCIGLKGGYLEKEDYALELLRIIWGDIAKKSKKDIDDALRGPPDKIQANKPQTKLQSLISEHIVNMHIDIHNIIKKMPASDKDHQVLQLQKCVSEHISKMHVETNGIITTPATKQTYSSRILFLAAEAHPSIS